ncbi:SAM-dependent methyltransferase [Paractinoplanes brasiliensis]|uniref:SAM-dependent methyltransferase n=1 Tax=Paractinoplanes brasiliensis TaxID=52695 RepID=UPI00105BCF09
MSDPRGLDPQWPDPARRYNDLLGGKDNFAADRASCAEIAKEFPAVHVAARENPRFSFARCGTWRRRKGSGSSSTSAAGCQ